MALDGRTSDHFGHERRARRVQLVTGISFVWAILVRMARFSRRDWDRVFSYRLENDLFVFTMGLLQVFGNLIPNWLAVTD